MYFLRNDLPPLSIEDYPTRDFYTAILDPHEWSNPEHLVFFWDPFEDEFRVGEMGAYDHNTLWNIYTDFGERDRDYSYDLYTIPRGYWIPDEGVLAIYWYMGSGRKGPTEEDFREVLKRLRLDDEEVDVLYVLS